MEVKIPVTVELTGEAPYSEETYTIVLEAVDGAPMPSESMLQITGDGTAEFSAITYSVPGVYEYTVTQQTGNNALGHYDATVYHVKVTVTNTQDGSGLSSTVVAYKNDDTSKTDTIRFTNTYDPEVQPIAITVNKVWSGTSQERPDSVTVQLMNGDEAVATVSLGDWNNWTYTWTDLDGHGSWDVKEINIPNGYSASYNRSGNVITIKNTEILIQTGQIKWPVPVLAGAGLLLILSGVTGLKKKRTTGDA